MTAVNSSKILEIDGTRLLLDGRPFFFQGLSFFNAIYNPSFNRSAAERLAWLHLFKENGVNALRVWCQWDCERPHVDLDPEHSLFTPQGEIRDRHLRTLIEIIEAIDDAQMVLEVVLFCHEKQPNLPVPTRERAARRLAECLRPYRNVILQVWNEDSSEVIRHFETIKAADPDRIVTNSPGGSSDLGDEAQNQVLDLLTPHTVRRGADRFWEVAPRQIAALLEKYGKPVIDDEPARCGIVQYGGIEGGTKPEQHVEQIRSVRAAGGYHTYHHDMFQSGYGAPVTPPSGLPDPDFSAFHRQVFDFLRDNTTW